jgi:diguanylate cyclase (GGDEF)-like protein/PAS domain S-box-containing protein
MTEIDDTYKKILDNLADGVYFVDRDRRIIYWNKGAERISGFKAEQVQGHFCQDNILNHITENGTPLCLDGCPLHATILDGNPRQAEIYLQHSNGHRVPIVVRTMPMRAENGEIIGAVETFSDNSKLMSIRHEVRRLQDAALRDHLTGIWNRRYMTSRLEVALWGFQHQGIPFGILFIDVDRFKAINDTYGHKTGDQILILVANTLQNNLRSEDTLARWGGEEFVVLMMGLEPAGMAAVAEKLTTLIKFSSIRIEDQDISVTVSVGMTLARKEDSVKILVDRADQNMYRSKKAGLNIVTGDPEDSGKLKPKGMRIGKKQDKNKA